MAGKTGTKNARNSLRVHLIRKRDDILDKIDLNLSQGSARNSPDENDAASFCADGDLAIRLATLKSVSLKEVEQALLRIDSGEYGKCKACEKDINTERLKALPHATLCIDCKRLEEEGML